jgi:hypothetical protein
MATEKKSAREMIGEFLRDTAVLVLVFYPLEMKALTRLDRALILLVSLLLLILGITIEVRRKA